MCDRSRSILRSVVFHEKLIGPQVVTKTHAFCEIRMIINVPTRGLHLSLHGGFVSHAPPNYPPRFHHSNNIWWYTQVMKLLLIQFSPVYCYFHLNRTIFPKTLCLFFLLMWDTKFHKHLKAYAHYNFVSFNMQALRQATKRSNHPPHRLLIYSWFEI